MTISDRLLDKLRLGELEPEHAKAVISELERTGELHRLEALEAAAEAFLEHYPPGPAVQQLRAEKRRSERSPTVAPVAPKKSVSALSWLALAAVVLLVVPWAFWPSSPSEVSDAVQNIESPFLLWDRSDIDCVGRVNCRAAAMAAYRAGKSAETEFDAYKSFDRATRLLERGGISPVPDEMSDIGDLQARAKVALDTRFAAGRLKFRNLATRRMYREMAAELDELKAAFPDERCLYYRWAVEKERELKDDGVYPIRRP